MRAMSVLSFEIRVCQNCGLRYPLTQGHPFGARCPHCLGETRVVLKKEMDEETQAKNKKGETIKAVLLDNIRSAWNVGSILRSADGFGFQHAYLCGITPTPEVNAVRKTSLGAENYVTWSAHKDAVNVVYKLKLEGWKIAALEEDARAISIVQHSKPALQSPIVLMLGNEVTGVDPQLLDLADQIYYIPMHGQKRSFNVANAFSIAAYALSQ